MVDAVIAVYLTNQRAGSPPGLVAAGPRGGKYYQEDCRKKMGANCVSTMHQNWLQPSLEEYPRCYNHYRVHDIHFPYHKLVILFLQACNSSKFGTRFRMEHTCNEEENTGASLSL